MCMVDHEHGAEGFKNTKSGVKQETDERKLIFPYTGMYARQGLPVTAADYFVYLTCMGVCAFAGMPMVAVNHMWPRV